MAACLMATACADDPSVNISDSWQGNDRVSLTLKAASETMAGGTRSVGVDVDEGNAAGYTVSDFIIFQFDENGNRIVAPHYYKYAADADGLSLPVVLPAVDGVEYTVVVLANVHETLSASAFADATTLDRLLQKYQKFGKQSEAWRGNDADGYDLLMNGYAKINKSTSRLEVTLFRNVAKFTLTITNPSSSGVTLRSAQVRSVPTKIDYFYHCIEDYKPEMLTLPYPSRNDFTTFDYDPDVISVAPGESKTLTYYLPAHLMGKSVSTSEKTKGIYAPHYSSFVELYGVNGDRSKIMRYRFYLGENLVDDYNVRPNYHYVLPLRFNSIGNPKNDARIESVSAVVEEGDANCHILNPLPTNEQRLYAIPVASRVNTFWQNEWAAGNVATSTGYTIANDDEWSAEIIWQTSGQQMIEFCDADGNPTANDGRQSPVYRGNTALCVKPKKGAKGNLIVGVYRTDQKGEREYSWSWHLWITDYNPDECSNQNWDGRYKYVLSNGSGEVHRYTGGSWDASDAKYHNKWMMDRNIGAMAAEGVWVDMEGMYYIFGRKDPFVDPQINLFSYNAATDSFVKYKKPASVWGAYVTIPYFTRHPNVEPNSSNSYYVNPYEANLWNNPDWFLTSEKSFFDPCPPGWKLPEIDVWYGILQHSFLQPTFDRYKVFIDGNDDGENYAFYPYGWIMQGGGFSMSNMMMYSSTPRTQERIVCLYALNRNTPNRLNIVDGSYNRTFHLSVRAIRE